MKKKESKYERTEEWNKERKEWKNENEHKISNTKQIIQVEKTSYKRVKTCPYNKEIK